MPAKPAFKAACVQPALQMLSASSQTGSGSCCMCACMHAKHTVRAACVQPALHMHSTQHRPTNRKLFPMLTCCMPGCLLSTQSCMCASSRVEQGSHKLPSLPQSQLQITIGNKRCESSTIHSQHTCPILPVVQTTIAATGQTCSPPTSDNKTSANSALHPRVH
jgi:hypothetical protein